jgi:integrase/recombinase XerD
LSHPEICQLTVRELTMRAGVQQLRVAGRGSTVCFLPVGMLAQRYIAEYLAAAGHQDDLDAPLFRPVKNNVTGELHKPLHPESVSQTIVKHYGKQLGLTVSVHGLGVHAWRATAVPHARMPGAENAAVPAWRVQTTSDVSPSHDTH